MNLASLRARLDTLAGRVPAPLSEWREVVFPIMDAGPTGPIHTGTVVRDTSTGLWREVPPNTETQTKG
jgi:hypothetical protein